VSFDAVALHRAQDRDESAAPESGEKNIAEEALEGMPESSVSRRRARYCAMNPHERTSSKLAKRLKMLEF
jgi:hypothetical protein